MKPEAFATEELVRLKPKNIHSYNTIMNIEKQKALIKLLLQQQVIMKIKMYYWIIISKTLNKLNLK